MRSGSSLSPAASRRWGSACWPVAACEASGSGAAPVSGGAGWRDQIHPPEGMVRAAEAGGLELTYRRHARDWDVVGLARGPRRRWWCRGQSSASRRTAPPAPASDGFYRTGWLGSPPAGHALALRWRAIGAPGRWLSRGADSAGRAEFALAGVRLSGCWPARRHLAGGLRRVPRRRGPVGVGHGGAERLIWTRTYPPPAPLLCAPNRRYTGDRRSPSPCGPYNARYTGDPRSAVGPICGDDHPCITRSAHYVGGCDVTVGDRARDG